MGWAAMARDAIAELYDLFRDLDRRISSFDKKIEQVFRNNDACLPIAKIKGVGPKTATAVVAAIGDGSEFKNGRDLAAWVGLVPRQFSSGDRKVLMGVSKRGNQHLRSLLGSPSMRRGRCRCLRGHGGSHLQAGWGPPDHLLPAMLRTGQRIERRYTGTQTRGRASVTGLL